MTCRAHHDRFDRQMIVFPVTSAHVLDDGKSSTRATHAPVLRTVLAVFREGDHVRARSILGARRTAATAALSPLETTMPVSNHSTGF